MSDIFSRRDVIQKGAVVACGVSLLGLAACTDKKSEAPAAATNTTAPQADTPSGDPLVSLDHPSAKSLKYVHDGSTVDPALRVEKSGVAGADQACSNCNFYKQVEGQTYGKCTLIPVKHVAAKGWCITWANKS